LDFLIGFLLGAIIGVGGGFIGFSIADIRWRRRKR